MAGKNTKPSTSQTITVVLLLLATFVLPPLGLIGLILMWIWMKWHMSIKIVAIVVVCIFNLIFAGGFLSSFNPQGARNLGSCVKACNAQYGETSSPQRTACMTVCGKNNH